MIRTLLSRSILAIFPVSLAAAAQAESLTAEQIAGAVKDPAAPRISDTTVRVNSAAGVERTATADASGQLADQTLAFVPATFGKIPGTSAGPRIIQFALQGSF